MASKGLQSFSRSLRTLQNYGSGVRDPLAQCLAPQLSRSMATEAPLPTPQTHQQFEHTKNNHISQFSDAKVLTTLYSFPHLEPLKFLSYPSKHLYLPLRRDLLHRAVIYEGDSHRQGTASSKTRFEVHGSHRKIRPQKGSGRARLGTRQSPVIVGGGKSFGPKPRDFSSDLPRKMYDLAWRTALSWRYRRGELIVVEDGADLEYPQPDFVGNVFGANHWGRGNGRTLIVTSGERENLYEAMEGAGEHGRVLEREDVDVKDLLELGRVVVEKGALDWLLESHQSDMTSRVKILVPGAGNAPDVRV